MVLRAFVLAALVGCGGCQTLAFYGQAVNGQWQLMRAGEDVSALIASPATDEGLRARLQYVGEILGFAQETLRLEVSGRYTRYVALDREYVLWNVFAAEEFSTRGHTWCYPIAGCAVYRGFFSRERAQLEATRMLLRRYEVAITGVPAFSTLGWFDDPLLSTFLFWPAHDVAALLIHELTHGRVFVGGDSSFNESYATFVEGEGVRALLESRHDAAGLVAFRAKQRAQERMTRFLLRWRDELTTLYRQPYPPMAKRFLKAELLQAMRDCYLEHSDALDGGGRRAWILAGLDNADLVPLATYADHVPAFTALFRTHEQSWGAFHAAVERLAKLGRTEREAELERLSDQQVAHAADDRDTDQVQCETFAHHVADGEPAGAEHDDIRRRRDG